jgi:hypothetical protein
MAAPSLVLVFGGPPLRVLGELGEGDALELAAELRLSKNKQRWPKPSAADSRACGSFSWVGGVTWAAWLFCGRRRVRGADTPTAIESGAGER